MLYTPQQAQEKLGIKPSTLRKYSALYRVHLSEVGNPKAHGQRRYTAGDLAVLQQVLSLRDAGVPLGEVSARLNVTDIPPEETTALVTVSEKIQSMYEQIAKTALMLADQEREISNQREQINTLVSRLDELESQSLWERLFRKRK